MSAPAAKQAQLSLACNAEDVSPIADMPSSVNNAHHAHHAHQGITSVTLVRMDLPSKAKPNMTLGLARLN